MADYDAGWLSGQRYDALRAADFERFCEAAARDLHAPVPTCPEWDVTGLCDHLARVYQGRGYVIGHASFLDSSAFQVRPDDVDPLAWLREWSAALDRALHDLPDGHPTVTFMPEASTVHFWRRRMALETLVHRTDAEIAQGQVSPMDDALSADGVDELLWFGSHPENDDDDGLTASSVVALGDGEHAWRVALEQRCMERVGDDRKADATVSGSAPALLLALSGRDLDGIGASRFGVELPNVEGDRASYDRLRQRLGDF